MITEKNVNSIYQKLLDQASKEFECSNYNVALRNVENAARWAYNFNVFYTDSRAELLLKSISRRCLEKKQAIIEKERFVVLDTEGLDNRGLTQQYLRALEANHFEYLFITLRSDISPLKDTIAEIENSTYGHVITFEGKKLTLMEKAERIRNMIIQFHAGKVLLHLMPWDVSSLIAIYSIEGVESYNINLTDHAFWLGASFINFNIEFRPYGKTVSLQKRRLSLEQLLEYPFYPIKPLKNNFEGFPEIPHDSIVIFTGGAPYKMTDADNTFFLKIIDGILGLSPKVVVLVAGFSRNDVSFQNNIKEMKHKDRVYNIGIRKDINEVYKHSDIYLQTYPSYGGLMTQYAIMNRKPVLNFVKKGEIISFEGMVNHFGKGTKCFENYDEFISYGKRLIEDKEYRVSEGEKGYNLMMNEERFNKMFVEVIFNHKNNFSWPTIDIDYESVSNSYISLAKIQNYAILRLLVNEYGCFRCLCLFPDCWHFILPWIYKNKLIYKIKNGVYRLFHGNNTL
ncbi:MAG: hypothetical protein IJV23_03775 [Prevotella sp.]|nr:hypothetical protein [Prevotella sp.]